MAAEFFYNKAVVNQLDNLQQMLQYDKEHFVTSNAELPPLTDVEKENIENKIQSVRRKRQEALASLEKEYHTTTIALQSTLDNLQKTDKYITHQDQTIQSQQTKIMGLKTEIDLLRREIEIGEYNYSQKSYTIFFLKHLFVFGIISILITMLYKKGTISGRVMWGVEMGLIGILVLLFVYNAWYFRYRNANEFSTMDWPR